MRTLRFLIIAPPVADSTSCALKAWASGIQGGTR
jgi:hypothetical protein